MRMMDCGVCIRTARKSRKRPQMSFRQNSASASRLAYTPEESTRVATTPADKRAEADRRAVAARKRFLESEAHRKLLVELAKR